MTSRRELARLQDEERHGSAGSLTVGSAPQRAPLTPEAWSRLILQHRRRVVLSLVAAGFDFEAAEELAHEAWTRLMEKDRDGRLPELKLPGLAIVQARFLAWDERRRQRAQRAQRHPLDLEAAEELVVDGQADPEQRILTRQDATRALAAIAAAPVSAQRLFRLLYAEPGMPHARAAEILELSVQRVRQLLCELRKSVRAALQGEGS
jgi:RNA polymerase sigma factor (sigma-70 family)